MKKVKTEIYSRIIRSLSELQKAAHHLRYEQSMLEYTLSRLKRDPKPLNLEFAMLMESFLIHTRNLNGFFYGWELSNEENKRLLKNDVIVEDYFEKEHPWNKPQNCRIPTELRHRIDQQLAHITFGREIGHYGDWNFTGMYNNIMTLFYSFNNSVDPEKIKKIY